MSGPGLLAGLRARAELEERCRTVPGALAVLDERGGADIPPGGWVTVPDVADVLEAVALREMEERLTAKRAEYPGRVAELRRALPEPGVPYELPRFTERFQALLECLRLHAELGELDEVMELANLGAGFVLDPEAERNPLVDNLAGELLWAVAEGVGAEAYFSQALDYFRAASEGLHEARMPLDVRRGYDLMIAERCLRLRAAGLPGEEELLGAAGAALARIDPAHDRLPDVAEARFAVARLRGDRPTLERLASRRALSEASRRAAGLLARLDGVAEWEEELGPFAAAIYGACLDLDQGRAFARFGMEELPGSAAGHRSARVGDMVLAEAWCDEVAAGIHRWARAAPGAGAAFVREGVRLPVRRAVPDVLGELLDEVSWRGAELAAALEPGLAAHDRGDHAGALEVFAGVAARWPNDPWPRHEQAVTSFALDPDADRLRHPAVVATLERDPFSFRTLRLCDPERAELVRERIEPVTENDDLSPAALVGFADAAAHLDDWSAAHARLLLDRLGIAYGEGPERPGWWWSPGVRATGCGRRVTWRGPRRWSPGCGR